MAHIQPFRAFRYDTEKVSPAQVVTQPYDKITPELQDRYYAASPHNLVRIVLGRREKADNAGNNVYSRADGHFRDWRRQGILHQDSQPSLYVYSQRFSPPGSTTALERHGFIALGRAAGACVAAREKREHVGPPSEPQLRVGAGIAAALPKWR